MVGEATMMHLRVCAIFWSRHFLGGEDLSAGAASRTFEGW
jgi:hypothetical protein